MTGRAFRILALAALLAIVPGRFPRLGAQDLSLAPATPEKQVALPLPRFRQVDVGGKPQSFTRDQIIILADNDFPPFSYSGPAGDPQGIAVDAARAACQELHTSCQVVLMSWQSLTGDPASGGIVAGLRVDEATLEKFQPTRPIYRSLGRFAVRKENDIAQMTRAAVAGKRIGVVAGSGYEAWLRRNYEDSVVVTYPSLAELQEALRTARVEVLFGDALQLVYWMRGSASQGCCKYVDGAYYDDASFSRPYVFLVRRGDEELKQAFDYALDRLQESGTFARIFSRYIPAPFW
ncbi:MAG: transporter substrate-binding domain-containing protein [Parvibaculaceae bacterium]